MAAILAALKAALSNGVVGGGIVLMLTGAVMALARNVPNRIWSFVERRFTVTVDVASHDPLFGWLTIWLDEHPYSKKARRITATSSGGGGRAEPALTSSSRSEKPELPKIMFTPAPGAHLLWVGGRPLWLTRDRKETQEHGWTTYRETYTLRTFGSDPLAAKKVLEDARDRAMKDQNRVVGVYTLRYGDWYRVHESAPRALESVVLPAGVMEDLVGDAERFLESEKWYRDHGIPWRRGYLFDGTPGSGKTSSIAALAGHIGMDLYLCNVGDRMMNDERLTGSLLSVSPRSVVLLEDVDSVVSGREVKEDSGVTFAGLLNALDGVASQPGIITVLTTNHPENLDPALVRHGRVDKTIHFAGSTKEQARRFFITFYGTDAGADEFAAWGEGKPVAELQAMCLENRDDPNETIMAIKPLRSTRTGAA